MKLNDFISTLPYSIAAIFLSGTIALMLDGRFSLTPEDLFSIGVVLIVLYFVLLPFKRR